MKNITIPPWSPGWLYQTVCILYDRRGRSSRSSLILSDLFSSVEISAEPGYYKDGHFGIRIENIVIVRDAKTPYNFGDKGYLGFEHVTMVNRHVFYISCVWLIGGQCPMQTKLVAQELLSPSERRWINSYHVEVLRKVSPLLSNDERALRWLQKECAEI